ncbi:DNA-processing protein DprA [Candidatus Dependentiae bacterium]|nr:DNA-processing protein DprA [Candidatus Dependentiae bacterium]
METWLRLSRFPVQNKEKFRLLKEYKDSGAVLKYLEKHRVSALIKETKLPFNIEKDLKKLKDINGGLITIFDKEYPKILREIFDPPIVLYYRGRIELLKNFSIGIVGTRKPTKYGVTATEYFVDELVNRQVTIISGLAIGCDAIAHKRTLKQKGDTIAVLGTGIDVVYPATNRSIFKLIEQNGLLISEFPIGTPSLPHNFPSRNRIISGLSSGVIVIQAGDWSGSLITAYNALNQGREVFAVPGNIFNKMSNGCHSLIKQGAKLISSVEDILEEFSNPDLFSNTSNHTYEKNVELSKDAQDLLEVFENGPVEFDEICKQSSFAPGYLLSLLTELELNNILIKIDGCSYGKKYN